MGKTNGWQISAIIIGIIGFIGSITLALNLKSLYIFATAMFSIYILCMLIYGIGTLIEQNDIIIEILHEKTKQ